MERHEDKPRYQEAVLMYILGLCCYYHDASAALLEDGKVVAACHEERFTRRKHDQSFPENAIRQCLESEGIGMEDVSHIAFYEKPILKLERVLSMHVDAFPSSFRQFVSSMPGWLGEKLHIKKRLRGLGFRGDVHFIEHHLGHAASFLLSPFDSAAIVVVDGVGEWLTTSIGSCKGTQVRLMESQSYPHSLGLFYSAMTSYLGFEVNNGEYKMMGLAAYGDNSSANKYLHALNDVLSIDDGIIRFQPGHFAFDSTRMFTAKLCDVLGPNRKPGQPIERRHKDIAAATQMLYENALYSILERARKRTGQENLVLCGGCALNSVANGRITMKTGFKNIWIQPDPGDGGTCIGAAAYMYSRLAKKRPSELKSAALGPGNTDGEIRSFLQENRIDYHECSSTAELLEYTTGMLAEYKVIGWFQGRMEFGQRALGMRSILANPCNPKAKDILNRKVKHREPWRPFAPSVCAEDADRYFEMDGQAPTDFMLMVRPVRKEWRKALSSVTHADGSARVHTVGKQSDPLFHGLLKAFGSVSGVPILINTSFNDAGEPIVCSPGDACRCFFQTGIDCLVIGSFIITKMTTGENW